MSNLAIRQHINKMISAPHLNSWCLQHLLIMPQYSTLKSLFYKRVSLRIAAFSLSVMQNEQAMQ